MRMGRPTRVWDKYAYGTEQPHTACSNSIDILNPDHFWSGRTIFGCQIWSRRTKFREPDQNFRYRPIIKWLACFKTGQIANRAVKYTTAAPVYNLMDTHN